MKIFKNKYFIPCFLLLFCITACKVQRPKDLITEKKMEDLLYDYHLAKAMGDNLPYTENYKKALYMEYVFKKYNTTETVFDSSMVWYTRNTEVLAKIYENVTKRLKNQQDVINTLVSIRDNKPKISQPGDSVDLWIWNRLCLLSEHPLNNKIVFSLPSDSNFQARDTLIWSVNYNFLDVLPDSVNNVVMAMQVHYSNDSIISETKKILTSGVHSIILQADTLGDIDDIKGFIYFANRKDSLKHILTNQYTLMRYHSQDTLVIAKDSISEPTLKKEEVEAVIESKTEIKESTEVEKRRLDRPKPANLREIPIEVPVQK